MLGLGLGLGYRTDWVRGDIRVRASFRVRVRVRARIAGEVRVWVRSRVRAGSRAREPEDHPAGRGYVVGVMVMHVHPQRITPQVAEFEEALPRLEHMHAYHGYKVRVRPLSDSSTCSQASGYG